jgi:hypothetical protein
MRKTNCIVALMVLLLSEFPIPTIKYPSPRRCDLRGNGCPSKCLARSHFKIEPFAEWEFLAVNASTRR